MSFFAEYIDNKYQNTPEYFNGEFFKMAISFAILFKATDKIVKNSDWYVSASYIKPFIVPYTISKIICNLPIGYCLDYDLIWRKQELYPSLNRQIEKVAHITNDFIQQSNGSAREYCSKEDTWKKYKAIPLSLDSQFIDCSEHQTFIRKANGMPYTEPHHLVPMRAQKDFSVSLDVENNIVSLCSNCHNLIHYGKGAEILLKKIYNEREQLLQQAGIVITFEDLMNYYK